MNIQRFLPLHPERAHKDYHTTWFTNGSNIGHINATLNKVFAALSKKMMRFFTGEPIVLISGWFR